jgi:heat shock protein HtpX
MNFMKRIFLFLLVNALVMVTISIILSVLGVGPYLTKTGLDYGNLMAFCLVWGMGGAFISLLISRKMAKWTMGVQLIDPNTHDHQLRQLFQTVADLSRSAGLPKTPEVGVYESDEVNAFATGPTKSRALVAVSSGLLRRMNERELRGVLGHEIAHIANGDMVTLTLIQGVINAFVMFLARVLAYAISMAGRSGDERDDRGPGFSYFIIQHLLEMVLMVFGSMVVAWFSRFREFRADTGGAKIAGKQNMIDALECLRRMYEAPFQNAEEGGKSQSAMSAFKISSKSGGFLKLFSTHPPLEDRIERLRNSPLY